MTFETGEIEEEINVNGNADEFNDATGQNLDEATAQMHEQLQNNKVQNMEVSQNSKTNSDEYSASETQNHPGAGVSLPVRSNQYGTSGLL